MVMRSKALYAFLLLSLVLTACSLGAPADSPPAPPQAPDEGEAEAATPAPAPTATPAPPTEPPTQAAPTEPPMDDDEIPKGSSALKASDPSQVSLTGDKPRLVEFFAFW